MTGVLTVCLFGVFARPLCPAASEAQPPLVLFDFGKGFDVQAVEARDATASLARRMAGNALRIQTGRKDSFPGVTLKAPQGKWDLTAYEYIALTLTNPGEATVTVSVRADSSGGDGNKNSVSGSVSVGPKASEMLVVRLSPSAVRLSEPLDLIGMRRAPGERARIDPSDVTRLTVFVTKPSRDYAFEIADVRTGGHVTSLDGKTFLPFIDEFGQFIHKEWPGKTHSMEEMIANGKAEEKDLAARPGPPDRDQYGGWTAGPKLAATGFFRVEKYEGKWWLVDPEGRLFWSHGIDCVRAANSTPIGDRENYYRNLPKDDSPFARFYGSGRFAAHGYYEKLSSYRTYDFTRANLLRKYGENWERTFADVAHRRLKSWGMNTIANWSDRAICEMRRTPYTATVGGGGIRIEGSEGYWGKFYDVFDPIFQASIRNAVLREKGGAAGDPWCLGFFVHNELGWGDEVSLAVGALASPADQAAKKVFVADLKAKYQTIEKLNAAWGTNHASWEALLQSKETPDKKKAWDDLTAFYTKIAETYFKTIRDEVKAVAPNQLYLGCRFAWVNDRAARAAAKFCDIIAYNRYSYSVADHRLPEGLDKPTVVGEFHFGALDRGMFHTGLKETANQDDRAAKYKSYVQGALRNPYMVGTHWFQYLDQATTGRSDGENYQIGFVDICDKPYPETIAACRDVGYGMYEYRLKEK
jgi:hypothetical protein